MWWPPPPTSIFTMETFRPVMIPPPPFLTSIFTMETFRPVMTPSPAHLYLHHGNLKACDDTPPFISSPWKPKGLWWPPPPLSHLSSPWKPSGLWRQPLPLLTSIFTMETFRPVMTPSPAHLYLHHGNLKACDDTRAPAHLYLHHGNLQACDDPPPLLLTSIFTMETFRPVMTPPPAHIYLHHGNLQACDDTPPPPPIVLECLSLVV